MDTPAFQVLVTGREKLRPFRYPVIVKPNQEGTSKGITPEERRATTRRACARSRASSSSGTGSRRSSRSTSSGRELTVGLLGEKRPRVLPPMEVVFLKQAERPVYDYECKQHWPEHVRYECPANAHEGGAARRSSARAARRS